MSDVDTTVGLGEGRPFGIIAEISRLYRPNYRSRSSSVNK